MSKSKEKKIIIFICILFALLFISNIVFIIKYYKSQVPIIEERIYYDSLHEYDKDIKYYQEITFKKYTKLIEQNEVITIAVVDNSSKTYNHFLEMINKISYYKRNNIYLLEISKLSKNNEIKFYELDDRLKELESDYLITIKNNKVLGITTFDTNELASIIESIE